MQGAGSPDTPVDEFSAAGSRFQILAIDGGGVLGIFAAALLAGLEEDLGQPICERFDLVVGTSTGGIIALGLGAGLTPREILDFYVEQKDRIFGNRMGWRAFRHLFAAKYGAGRLRDALQVFTMWMSQRRCVNHCTAC